MKTLIRVALGIAVFVASFVTLSLMVLPWAMESGGRTPLNEAQIRRIPVVVRPLSSATKPGLWVVRVGDLPEAEKKIGRATFLLPVGSASFADQDGDGAKYTAEALSPARQRIQLRARTGEYLHDVEYEAEEQAVFPLRDRVTGPESAILAFVLSVVIAWIVLRLAGRMTNPSSKRG